MAVRQLAPILGSRGVSGAKFRRLGGLLKVDFPHFRPAARAVRIVSDKPTLSDMEINRQARRIWRRFQS
nr:Hypothetical protein SC2p1_00200 [Methylocystis sp. SC2]